MPVYIKVASTDEVEPGRGKLVAIQGKDIALFNVDEKYYAIDNTCTHRGGPLAEGIVVGDEVTCPLHGAKFKVTSGEVCGPPAGKGVRNYNLRVSGSDIEIEL